MHTPQIILILLTVYICTVHLVRNGEPRPPYNLVHWILAAIVEIGLLFWGGFFALAEWPQIVYMSLVVASAAIVALKPDARGPYSISSMLFTNTVVLPIFYAGGFFG